ncbi:hypothetical protein [Nocardia sp. NPDC059228]|uniref:hypothetical protein n=1 Tax=Nocardia sp. NPDC059228 TaxID=3346777 RepID=UPI0036C67C1F
MTTQGRPAVCVSYLAAAELWSVPKFPAPNHGAEILTTEESIAADGPMTAAVLAALDVPTLLVANRIGNDDVGGRVGRWLQQHHVPSTAVVSADVVTPKIVVVADGRDTRTWFAYLPEVTDELSRCDLSPIGTASMVYLDAYQLIEAAVIRVVRAARDCGTELLVNLGGSPLSDALRLELSGYQNLIIQTNVDDESRSGVPAAQQAHLLGRDLEDPRGASVILHRGSAHDQAHGSRLGDLPFHGRPLAQETVAQWLKLTQSAIRWSAWSLSAGMVTVPCLPAPPTRSVHDCAGKQLRWR